MPVCHVRKTNNNESISTAAQKNCPKSQIPNLGFGRENVSHRILSQNSLFQFLGFGSYTDPKEYILGKKLAQTVLWESFWDRLAQNWCPTNINDCKYIPSTARRRVAVGCSRTARARSTSRPPRVAPALCGPALLAPADRQPSVLLTSVVPRSVVPWSVVPPLWSRALWSRAPCSRRPSSRALFSRALWFRALWSRAKWSRALWSRALWSRALWSRALWSRALWSRAPCSRLSWLPPSVLPPSLLP
jgi:hypothetical protein